MKKHLYIPPACRKPDIPLRRPLCLSNINGSTADDENSSGAWWSDDSETLSW